MFFINILEAINFINAALKFAIYISIACILMMLTIAGCKKVILNLFNKCKNFLKKKGLFFKEATESSNVENFLSSSLNATANLYPGNTELGKVRIATAIPAESVQTFAKYR